LHEKTTLRATKNKAITQFMAAAIRDAHGFESARKLA
jgi:hypothetical protein